MKAAAAALTTEERARAEAYAEAECDRINPRCRAAYRATIFAKRSAEILEDRNRQAAFQGLILDQALANIVDRTDRLWESDAAAGAWQADPVERRAARERGLLLARMEREQGVDASWT